jgi:hypothetical protein
LRNWPIAHRKPAAQKHRQRKKQSVRHVTQAPHSYHIYRVFDLADHASGLRFFDLSQPVTVGIIFQI